MRRLSIELTESLHQQIKAQASLQGLSMRAYVLQKLGLSGDRSSRPAETSMRTDLGASAEPGSMRELILNRPWQGEKTKAEIDAQIAEERADWHER